MAHKKKKLADLELLLNGGINDFSTLTAAIKDVKNELTLGDLVSLNSSIEPFRENTHSQPVYQTIKQELLLRNDLDRLNINDLLSSSFYSSLSSSLHSNDQTYSLSDTLKRVNLYTRYHKEELDIPNLESLKTKMREAYFAKEERTKEDLSEYRSAVATINAIIRKKNKETNCVPIILSDNLAASSQKDFSRTLPLVESPPSLPYSKETGDLDDWEDKELEGSTKEELRDFLCPSISPEDLIIRPDILDGFTEDTYCSKYTSLLSFNMLELGDLKQAMESVDTIYQQRSTGASLAEKRALRDANNDIKANLLNIFYDYSSTILDEVRSSLKMSSLREDLYEHHIEQLASVQEAVSTFDVQETFRRQELQTQAVALATQLEKKYDSQTNSVPTTPDKRPVYTPRETSRLRFAFAGLSSVLIFGAAYALIPSTEVKGSEITDRGEITLANNPGIISSSTPESRNLAAKNSKPKILPYTSSQLDQKAEQETLLRSSQFHQLNTSPQDVQPKSSEKTEYIVTSGDSLISIATNAYCSDLTGKKKGHCGVDAGMALGQLNNQIRNNGRISLHPKNTLELPSESTMREYVRSHESQLHHQFGRVRQHYSRR